MTVPVLLTNYAEPISRIAIVFGCFWMFYLFLFNWMYVGFNVPSVSLKSGSEVYIALFNILFIVGRIWA